MRLKVKLAFMILGLVLSLAGVTSYLELARLTEDVQAVIDKGANSVTLSKGVLDIIEKHNMNIISLSENKNEKHIKLSDAEIKLMDSLYYQASEAYSLSKELEAVANAQQRYIDIVNMASNPNTPRGKYLTDYISAYSIYTSHVKEYMLTSQQYVVKHTHELRNSIYRSTMQSVVALSVSIIILFVFFIMLDIFFIKPVVVMTKSLGKYIKSGSSFNAKVVGNDEPKQLKEHIEHIIRQHK